MKHNMGKNERFTRTLVGIGILALSLWFGFVGMLALQLILAFVGLAFTITGIFAYCPGNASLNRNSCRACKVGESHLHMPI